MYIFLSPDRLSWRNDVMLDKVNFRPEITTFFSKNQDIKILRLFKFVINIKLR